MRRLKDTSVTFLLVVNAIEYTILMCAMIGTQAKMCAFGAMVEW